jgi:hypothetical protein
MNFEEWRSYGMACCAAGGTYAFDGIAQRAKNEYFKLKKMGSAFKDF